MISRNSVIREFAVGYQKNKAEIALAKAKKLEKEQKKKPVRLNSKTILLK
ncbi:hypothetical protein [Tenacibaculum piscium]|nr:hypothetical protein [Tenacibaculum piscium]